jgi:hypothetical protein
MNFYFILSLILLILYFYLFISIYIKNRVLVILPSSYLSFFYVIYITFGATFAVNAEFMKYPIHIKFLALNVTHVLPLIWLFIGKTFHKKNALNIRSDIISFKTNLKSGSLKFHYYYFIFFILILFFSVMYFSQISYRQTGLYAAFFNSANYDDLRFYSGNNLTSILLKNYLSLIERVLGPAFCICSTLMLFVVTSLLKKFLIGLSMLFVTILVSVTGAKSPAVVCIFAILLSLFLVYQPVINPLKVVGTICLLLSFPVLINFAKFDGLPSKRIQCSLVMTVDRIGYGYLDNFWYLQKLSDTGTTGFQNVSIFNKLSKNDYPSVGMQIGSKYGGENGKSVFSFLNQNCSSIKAPTLESTISSPNPSPKSFSMNSVASFASNLVLSFGFFGVAISILLVFFLNYWYQIFIKLNLKTKILMYVLCVIFIINLTYAEFMSVLVKNLFFTALILMLIDFLEMCLNLMHNKFRYLIKI